MRIRESYIDYSTNKEQIAFKYVDPVWRGNHVFVASQIHSEWQPDKCTCDEYLTHCDEEDCICDPEKVELKITKHSVYHIATGYRLSAVDKDIDRVIRFAKDLDCDKTIDWSLVRKCGHIQNRGGDIKAMPEIYELYREIYFTWLSYHIKYLGKPI